MVCSLKSFGNIFGMVAIDYCTGNKMFDRFAVLAKSWKTPRSIYFQGFEFPTKIAVIVDIATGKPPGIESIKLWQYTMYFISLVQDIMSNIQCKIPLLLAFITTRFSVYFATSSKRSAGTILPCKPYPALSTYNTDFMTLAVR